MGPMTTVLALDRIKSRLFQLKYREEKMKRCTTTALWMLLILAATLFQEVTPSRAGAIQTSNWQIKAVILYHSGNGVIVDTTVDNPLPPASWSLNGTSVGHGTIFQHVSRFLFHLGQNRRLLRDKAQNTITARFSDGRTVEKSIYIDYDKIDKKWPHEFH